MTESVPFDDLEVVGYADSLPDDLLPRLVAPIYRRLSTREFILPPFELSDGVTGSLRATEAEFTQAVARGEATVVKPPIAARTGYQLWIDRDRSAHYQLAEQVSVHLRSVAKEIVRKAKTALRKGHYEHAGRLAQTALAADERCLDALLVKGIVLKHEGRSDETAVIVDIANVVAPDVDFESWIDLYSDEVTIVTPVVSRTTGRSSRVLDNVSSVTGLPRKHVGKVLGALAALVAVDMAKHGGFTLPGLAKMKVVKKAATKAGKRINPFTKEPAIFKGKPPRKRLLKAVKAVKTLKDRLT